MRWATSIKVERKRIHKQNRLRVEAESLLLKLEEADREGTAMPVTIPEVNEGRNGGDMINIPKAARSGGENIIESG
jgi:hypothetical protein